MEEKTQKEKIVFRYEWIKHPFNGRDIDDELENDVISYLHDMHILKYEPIMISFSTRSWLWRKKVVAVDMSNVIKPETKIIKI